MKQIYYLNLFAVGLPIALCLAGIFNEIFLFYGLLSTMLTGLIQIVLGVNMLIDEPKDRSLKIYFFSIVLFFLLWILAAYNNHYLDKLSYVLLAIPPILAVYLTLIIIKKMKK